MAEQDAKPTVDDARSAIINSLLMLKDLKPNDRSEQDRRYAIAITEMEKVVAYTEHYLFQGIAYEAGPTPPIK